MLEDDVSQRWLYRNRSCWSTWSLRSVQFSMHLSKSQNNLHLIQSRPFSFQTFLMTLNHSLFFSISLAILTFPHRSILASNNIDVSSMKAKRKWFSEGPCWILSSHLRTNKPTKKHRMVLISFWLFLSKFYSLLCIFSLRSSDCLPQLSNLWLRFHKTHPRRRTGLRLCLSSSSLYLGCNEILGWCRISNDSRNDQSLRLCSHGLCSRRTSLDPTSTPST